MITYFIILIFSVIFHELGHLFMSLFWKVKVKACAFGFGKVLLHKKWKGIDWRICAIPFGGYCDIEEKLNTSNSLYSIHYFRQLDIILAGVGMNFLISSICYLINYGSIKTGLIIDWYLLKFCLTKQYDALNILLLNLGNINFFLLECSFINTTLGIANLLPLPSLDGGFVWLLLLRKKITEKTYSQIIKFGFIFVILIQIIFCYYFYFRS